MLHVERPHAREGRAVPSGKHYGTGTGGEPIRANVNSMVPSNVDASG